MTAPPRGPRGARLPPWFGARRVKGFPPPGTPRALACRRAALHLPLHGRLERGLVRGLELLCGSPRWLSPGRLAPVVGSSSSRWCDPLGVRWRRGAPLRLPEVIGPRFEIRHLFLEPLFFFRPCLGPVRSFCVRRAWAVGPTTHHVVFRFRSGRTNQYSKPPLNSAPGSRNTPKSVLNCDCVPFFFQTGIQVRHVPWALLRGDTGGLEFPGT